LALANALADKKGEEILVLDVHDLSSFTDFFVIATGTSARHVRTLAEHVVETARGFGERPLGVEGEKRAQWVLVDLDDVVVHLFQEEAREYYRIERLWGEAESVTPLHAAGAAG
jgi:ribosome-associated protein